MVRNGGDVAVVGAGVTAPGGACREALWASLLAGRAAMAPYRHPELPEAAAVVVAEAADYDAGRYVTYAESQRLDRVHLLAIGAADDALAHGVERPPPDRCAVVCGVGYGAAATLESLHRTIATNGMRGLSPFSVPLTMMNSAAAHLAIRYGFHGPCLTVSTACASGADAIGHGVELLRRGAADLVLAGGVDAMIALTPVLSFFKLGALTANRDPGTASRPFDRARDGFVLGEGAGFVVLRRLADARRDGAEVLGNVSGYAATCDAHHLVAPQDDGGAAQRCATNALADAGIGPAAVGHINAHGTSTALNDAAEGRAMAGVFSGAPPPVTAVKGVTGHMIGGSGAVEAIVTLMSLREGLVPPVAGYRTPDPAIPLDIVCGEPRKISAEYAISNSFGFGGHNAVLVLRAP
jgi:3-oxoacyl-[acyl-carrier-protein] synthase II